VTTLAPPAVAVVRRVALAPPAIPRDLLLRLQGYRNPAAAPEPVRDAASAAAHRAARLIAPRAVIRRVAVTARTTDAVTLGDDHAFESRLLARVLGTSTDAYVVALTIGGALERHVDALFRKHEPLDGLMLDTAGWAAIVLLMRGLRRRLRDEERRAGRSVTHRVGPGYGDWPIEDQAALLDVFGDVPLPVTVTESSLLLPRKSVSAVLGVVPAA
jgi:hypothetical protein